MKLEILNVVFLTYLTCFKNLLIGKITNKKNVKVYCLQNVFYVEVIVQFYQKYISWSFLLFQTSSKCRYIYISDILDTSYK